MIESKGFIINSINSDGLHATSFYVSGNFWFEDKDELITFKNDLTNLFVNHLGSYVNVYSQEDIDIQINLKG